MAESECIICPRCGTRNVPDRLHCRNCERDLTGQPVIPTSGVGESVVTVDYVICPDCGTKNFPERSHCLGCVRELSGLPHTPGAAQASAAAPTPTAVRTRQPDPPPAVIWYRVYCVVNLCVLVVAAIVALALASQPSQLEQTVLSMPDGIGSAFEDQFRQERQSAGALLMVLLSGMAALYAIGLGLKPTPGAWIYGILVLAIGLTGKCSLPFAVILLILWFQPATQQYFGRGKPPIASA